MNQAIKELHDQLLELRPEDASHESDGCVICSGQEPSIDETGPQGGSVKTYTEEEMASLLAQVAELEAKVKELEGARIENETEAKVAEVKAQYDDQISDLQKKLDTAVLEAQNAAKEKDDILGYFDQLEEERKQAEELARLRDERIEKVKEVAAFPDEYLQENADRWASMAEDAFEATLTDYKAVAAKSKDSKDDEVPVSTAMTAAREDSATGNPLRDVLRMRNSGIDPRTVV